MAAVISAAALGSQSARAADVLWNIQDGNWNVAGNWNPAALPGPGDAALVKFVGAGNPTAHVTTDVGTVQKVSVSNNNKISIETGGVLTANGGNDGNLGIRIGDGSIGSVDVGGTGQLKTSIADNGGDIHVGIAGGNGTLNLSGNGLVSQRDMKIGDGIGSTGLLNQTSGTTTIGGPGGGWLFVGMAGGTGEYKLSGGTLNASNADERRYFVGTNANSNGTFTIEGASTTATMPGALLISDDGGTGTFNMKGGNVTTSWVEAGANNTKVGTFNMSGGTFSTRYEINVGRNNGTGVFNMTGGTVNAGTDPGGNMFAVGRGGNGTFTMSGGNLNASTAFMLSVNETVNNVVNLGNGTGTQTGGTIHSNGWVSIGADRAATYTLSGGSMIADGDFNVSDNAGTSGTLNLSGTGVAQGNTVFIGKQPNTIALVNQTGGTMKVGGGNFFIANNPTSNGTYNLSGGVFDAQGHTMNYGPGTAAFVMTGGRLLNASAINFALNQAGGTLAPGGGVGITTITGAYTEALGAVLEIDINGVVAVTDYDQLAVTGQVTLVGDLSVLVGAGFTPALGQQFTVLDNQAATDILGFFTGKPEGSTFVVGSNAFQISYHGGTGNDVVLTAVPAPEPATVGLVGLALAGALGVRPRRRAR